MEHSDEVPDESGREVGGASQVGDPSGSGAGDLAGTTGTTLVEVVPGTAVVLGEVPEGLELADLGLISDVDRAGLATVLGAVGSTATVAGNLANAASSVQGLYRLSDASMALLRSGGELAVKDGANLGAILQNGKIVGQARFVPHGVSVAQTAAAIGPAVAMIALQMQLSEISGLVSANIALTTQALKTIRHEQWAELTGLATSIDRTIGQAQEIGGVTRTLWDNVAGKEDQVEKQLDLYQRNVDEHVRQLRQLQGGARRQYLESNAEAILFDANALLHALKAQTGYQALRAARARAEGVEDHQEAQLVDVITRDARTAFDAALRASTELVGALTQELRILAELPGRATVPLTKQRRNAKAERLTCVQLLEAIEPLADALQPANDELTVPDLLCGPEGLDVAPYLRVLRWLLEDGETLRAIAFAHEAGANDVLGIVSSVGAARVDATWSALVPGKKWSGALAKAVSGRFVAVTDRRVLTAAPRALVQRGDIGSAFPLSDVRYVRTVPKQDGSTRSSISVTTRDRDLRWVFPADADDGAITELAAMLAETMAIPDDEREAIASPRVREIEAGGEQPSEGES